MAENIWYATTETEWIKFSNGLRTITGNTGTGFGIYITPAENYDDESVGYITLGANGKETVKTIIRCLPNFIDSCSKLTCDIDYESGDNIIDPCKSNPIQDGRVTISNIKIETINYYSMDDSWEEITDCDVYEGCEKLECLSEMPESKVKSKSSTTYVDVTSCSILYRIEGENNYYTEIPPNLGAERKIYIKLQANGVSRDIDESEFYFIQKGVLGAQVGDGVLCRSGESSSVVEHENFYIEAENIPPSQYTWLGNNMSVSAYDYTHITQNSPSEEFASFFKNVESFKHIGAITGETCCEPKLNIIIDDGQTINCNNTDCPKRYEFRVIDSDTNAYFVGETLHFDANTSHSEYKSISVTAKLIDDINNIQKDSYKTITFILPPNTNGGGYNDIYLNAIVSKDELAYNETSVSFKWFLTRGSYYTGGWKDGYSDFNSIASIDGESDDAFFDAMTNNLNDNNVYIKVSNTTYRPLIGYDEEHGIFHVDNLPVGVNNTNTNRTIKLFINDCFLAFNHTATAQAIQKKAELYLHSYVIYNNSRYYDNNWPSLPVTGGNATIVYFLSQTQTINYNLYTEDYIIDELAYKDANAINALSCSCATNDTCICDEDEKCICSTAVTCSNSTGTYIKKKEVTLPSTIYENDKQTFKFTISCNGYVSGNKVVEILQNKFVPLYLYGYVKDDIYTIQSEGGKITLKWFMTSKNPDVIELITDSDAVAVNTNSFSGVGQNTFSVVTDTTSNFKWNQENTYLSLEGTTSYTNNIMMQTINIAENTDYGSNRTITFKVGNKDATNDMFSLRPVIQETEALYTYAYAVNSNGEKITEIDSEEQIITLKWFVTNIDTSSSEAENITDEDAVWDNKIENGWLTNDYAIWFNGDYSTVKRWDALSDSDGIVKVGTETTGEIHYQKFKVLNNTTADKVFTFGVSNSKAHEYGTHGQYEVSISQTAMLCSCNSIDADLTTITVSKAAHSTSEIITYMVVAKDCGEYVAGNIKIVSAGTNTEFLKVNGQVTIEGDNAKIPLSLKTALNENLSINPIISYLELYFQTNKCFNITFTQMSPDIDCGCNNIDKFIGYKRATVPAYEQTDFLIASARTYGCGTLRMEALDSIIFSDTRVEVINNIDYYLYANINESTEDRTSNYKIIYINKTHTECPTPQYQMQQKLVSRNCEDEMKVVDGDLYRKDVGTNYSYLYLPSYIPDYNDVERPSVKGIDLWCHISQSNRLTYRDSIEVVESSIYDGQDVQESWFVKESATNYYDLFAKINSNNSNSRRIYNLEVVKYLDETEYGGSRIACPGYVLESNIYQNAAITTCDQFLSAIRNYYSSDKFDENGLYKITGYKLLPSGDIRVSDVNGEYSDLVGCLYCPSAKIKLKPNNTYPNASLASILYGGDGLHSKNYNFLLFLITDDSTEFTAATTFYFSATLNDGNTECTFAKLEYSPCYCVCQDIQVNNNINDLNNDGIYPCFFSNFLGNTITACLISNVNTCGTIIAEMQPGSDWLEIDTTSNLAVSVRLKNRPTDEAEAEIKISIVGDPECGQDCNGEVGRTVVKYHNYVKCEAYASVYNNFEYDAQNVHDVSTSDIGTDIYCGDITVSSNGKYDYSGLGNGENDCKPLSISITQPDYVDAWLEYNSTNHSYKVWAKLKNNPGTVTPVFDINYLGVSIKTVSINFQQ